MKLWWRTLCYLALGTFLCHAPTAADQGLQFTIVPNSVAISTFYSGDRVTVTGQLPEDCEAVLLMGQSGDLKLKKKGKVGGLLWMNLDTVAFENVPSVFMLDTAREFSQLLGPNPELSQLKKLGGTMSNLGVYNVTLSGTTWPVQYRTRRDAMRAAKSAAFRGSNVRIERVAPNGRVYFVAAFAARLHSRASDSPNLPRRETADARRTRTR